MWYIHPFLKSDGRHPVWVIPSSHPVIRLTSILSYVIPSSIPVRRLIGILSYVIHSPLPVIGLISLLCYVIPSPSIPDSRLIKHPVFYDTFTPSCHQVNKHPVLCDTLNPPCHWVDKPAVLGETFTPSCDQADNHNVLSYTLHPFLSSCLKWTFIPLCPSYISPRLRLTSNLSYLIPYPFLYSSRQILNFWYSHSFLLLCCDRHLFLVW